MKKGESYTTNQIQEFLGINSAATLGKLKRLLKKGYLKLKKENRLYKWEKVEDMKEDQIYSGWLIG